MALSSIGVPIIGDPLYYSSTKTNTNSITERGYLHAYALRFEYLNKRYEFVLPPTQGEIFLSESVAEKLSEIKKPWSLSWPKL